MIVLVKGSEEIRVKDFDVLYEMFKDCLNSSQSLMEYVLSNYQLFVDGVKYEK